MLNICSTTSLNLLSPSSLFITSYSVLLTQEFAFYCMIYGLQIFISSLYRNIMKHVISLSASLEAFSIKFSYINEFEYVFCPVLQHLSLSLSHSRTLIDGNNPEGGYRNYATARAPAIKQPNQDIEVIHREGMNKIIGTLSPDSRSIFGCPTNDCMKERTLLIRKDYGNKFIQWNHLYLLFEIHLTHFISIYFPPPICILVL